MAEKKQKKSKDMKEQTENSSEKIEIRDTEYIEEITQPEDPSEAEDQKDEEAPPETGDQKKEDGDEPEKTIEEQLECSEAALKEANDRALRLSAEFENYKKRMTRETEEFRKYSNEVLIKQLLTVVDNLERAIESSKTEEITIESIAEGVEMTHKEILTILEKFNVSPINCKDKPFDPEFHQAVSQEETDETPENTVVRELMKGYMLHERLIRPSMVVVSKAAAKTDKKINEKV